MKMPAARMTDTHVCSMCFVPPGLPILMGSHNVMTKKLPQARMFDPITCVGPPDMIAFGSPTVLTNMRPTARMLDPTAKIGTITKGEPTVLIGMGGIIGAGLGLLAMAFVMSPPCVDLAQRLHENLAAQDDLMLADAAYLDDDAPLPENTRRANQADLEALGLHDGTTDLTQMPGRDFRCDVFVHTDPLTGNDSYVVSFRGTQPTSLDDWGTNFSQGVGMPTDYYNRSAEIGRTAGASQPGNVRFVGHSLGGGMASSAAGASGEPARTYNAAGMNAVTRYRTGGDTDNVEAYYLHQDPLNTIQDNTSYLTTGIVNAPAAQGNRRGYDGVGMSSEQSDADRSTRPNNSWIPDFIETPARDAMNDAAQWADPLANHGLERLDQALKKEEAEIREAQEANGCPI